MPSSLMQLYVHIGSARDRENCYSVRDDAHVTGSLRQRRNPSIQVPGNQRHEAD